MPKKFMFLWTNRSVREKYSLKSKNRIAQWIPREILVQNSGPKKIKKILCQKCHALIVAKNRNF